MLCEEYAVQFESLCLNVPVLLKIYFWIIVLYNPHLWQSILFYKNDFP